jgi:hypothetical protein
MSVQNIRTLVEFPYTYHRKDTLESFIRLKTPIGFDANKKANKVRALSNHNDRGNGNSIVITIKLLLLSQDWVIRPSL